MQNSRIGCQLSGRDAPAVWFGFLVLTVMILCRREDADFVVACKKLADMAHQLLEPGPVQCAAADALIAEPSHNLMPFPGRVGLDIGPLDGQAIPIFTQLVRC